MERLYGGIDMSSHQQVFTSLFTKVSSSPSSVQLLSILQALLLVDADRVEVWLALELLADRATLLAQDPEVDSADCLLERLLPHKSISANHRIRTIDRAVQTELPDRPPGQSEAVIKDILTTAASAVSFQAPLPPPPLSGIGAPPTPPPLPGMGAPPPPSGDITVAQTVQGVGRSYYSCTPLVNPAPCPTLRMKKLNWQKLPSRVVTAQQSLWTLVSSDSVEPDYCSIEQLFSLPPTESKTRTKAKTEPKEISFIDAKKSLNLNIFLKQFKCSHEDFVSLIQRGDRSRLDVEDLKQLIKLLPKKHEVENLKSHQTDRNRLASVDHFYLQLLDVPSYHLRIECMLLCEESCCLLKNLKANAELLDRACQSVRESTRLPSFCKLILDVGNFLNYGTHTGNAEGFKISTLLKLTETKASTSKITLLHHILEEVKQKHSDLLNLPDDLEICEKAAGVNLESIQSEVNSLNKQLKKSETKLSSEADDLKEQYLSAIQENESRRQQEKRRKQQEEEKEQHKGDTKTVRTDMSMQDEGCLIDNLLAEIRKGYNLKMTKPRAERGSLPPARRTRDSGVHDHAGRMERSLAVDEPELSVSSQSEQPAGPVRTPTDQPAADQSQTTEEQDPEVDLCPRLETRDGDPAGKEEVQLKPEDLNQSTANEESEFEEITSIELRTSKLADDPGPGESSGADVTSSQTGASPREATSHRVRVRRRTSRAVVANAVRLDPTGVSGGDGDAITASSPPDRPSHRETYSDLLHPSAPPPLRPGTPLMLCPPRSASVRVLIGRKQRRHHLDRR
ncbi:hypothetical protein PAMP_014681 [Pampus punctatissimus]